MNLRPDELAMQEELERDQRLRGYRDKAVGTAVSLGTTALGGATAFAGGKLASRVLPLLNQYVPTEMALKGISKISPKMGSFLKRGMEAGLNVQEGLDFIKDKLSGSLAAGEEKKMAKDARNIIQKHDDKLHEYLQMEIGKGRSPHQAAAIARTNPAFEKSIKKIEKEHKANWSSIIDAIFGAEQQAQQGQMQQQQQQQPQQMQGQQQAPQQGGGDQAIMAALQKILSM